MSKTLTAYFIVRDYIDEASTLINRLQGLDYASYMCSQEIKSQSLSPASMMNPWEEVNECTKKLKNCVKALKMDIESHQDTIRNMTGLEKVWDSCKDVYHCGKAEVNVLLGADQKTEARKMANMTHTGRGKYMLVSGFKNQGGDENYANLVERDQIWIDKVTRLIDAYDSEE